MKDSQGLNKIYHRDLLKLIPMFINFSLFSMNTVLLGIPYNDSSSNTNNRNLKYPIVSL